MIIQRLRKELLKIIFLKKIKAKKTCVRILIKFSRKAGLFLCFPCPDIIGILSGCCKNTLWLKDIDTGRIMGGSLGTIPSSFAGLPISKDHRN